MSVYHFWTIVLAIAGMVLYFICFKSTRENVVRIVAQPSLNISLQTLNGIAGCLRCASVRCVC